jgi:hypothetical protein
MAAGTHWNTDTPKGLVMNRIRNFARLDKPGITPAG